MKAVLVYQAGIANVFVVDSFTMKSEGRNARRLLQHAFTYAIPFTYGLATAGCQVITASCNKAGDIKDCEWTEGLDDCPFREHAVEIRENV